jgi:hypothetical protein
VSWANRERNLWTDNELLLLHNAFDLRSKLLYKMKSLQSCYNESFKIRSCAANPFWILFTGAFHIQLIPLHSGNENLWWQLKVFWIYKDVLTPLILFLLFGNTPRTVYSKDILYFSFIYSLCSCWSSASPLLICNQKNTRSNSIPVLWKYSL